MNTPKRFVVSALKFRPQTFAEVTGQEHITATLRNAIRRNRIANAYLFCGPRGVGKTSTARILAKALNCEDLQDGEPCNRCQACLTITQGRCMDVIELDAASNRGIDEVRDLRENVRFAPSSSRYKVYIIDEAHQLTKEAFNALLKTLEEPPPHAKFILATTEADKMLETIVSRCQQYRFKPLGLDRIVQNLRLILESQDAVALPPAIVDETLFLIAKTSDGGMRDAQSLFDQVMSLADDTLTLEEVELVLGGVRLDTLLEITTAVRSRDVAAGLEKVHRCYNQGQDLALLVRDLLGHFRNLLVCKTAPGRADLVGLPPDQVALLESQSKHLSLEDLLQGMDVLFEAERRLKLSGSPRAVCEAAVVKLAKMPTTVEIEALLGQRDFPLQPPPSPSGGTRAMASIAGSAVDTPLRDQARAASDTQDSATATSVVPFPQERVPTPRPGTETAAERHTGEVALLADPRTVAEGPAVAEDSPVARGELLPPKREVAIQMDDTPEQDVLDTLLAEWGSICHQVSEVNIPVGGFLGDAVPRSFEGNTLELALSESLSLHSKQLNKPEAKNLLREVLLKTLGVKPEIRINLVGSGEMAEIRPPAFEPETPAMRPLASVEDIVRTEPAIQEILDRFDGAVIDIRNNPNSR